MTPVKIWADEVAEPSDDPGVSGPTLVDLFGDEETNPLTTSRIIRALFVIAENGWTYDRAADEYLLSRGLVKYSGIVDPNDAMFGVTDTGVRIQSALVELFDRSLAEMVKSGDAKPVFEQADLFGGTVAP